VTAALLAVASGCGTDRTPPVGTAAPTGTTTTAGTTTNAPLVVPVAQVTLGQSAAQTVVTPAPGTEVKQLDAATSRLLVDLPRSDAGWRVELTVEVPAGVSVEAAGDGGAGAATKLVVDERGDSTAGNDLLLGLVAPRDGYQKVRLGDLGHPFGGAVPRHGVVGTGSWLVGDPDRSARTARTVTLAAVIDAPGAPGSARRARATSTAVVVGTDLIASVAWRADGDDGGGSYVVTPTLWGRMSGKIGRLHLTAALRAHEPAAATDVVEKQLLCHAVGAPSKDTWNLEPWRPDVSVADYLLAGCNPR
jgi:hypothetical protein